MPSRGCGNEVFREHGAARVHISIVIVRGSTSEAGSVYEREETCISDTRRLRELSAALRSALLPARYTVPMKATALVKGSFIHAWAMFMRRPWFATGSVIAVFLVSAISGAIAQIVAETGTTGTVALINILDLFVVQIFVSMGLIAWSLKAASDIGAVTWGDLWAPQRYWKYLGASLLVMIVEVIGFILLIIPGIIASVFLLFSPFIVMDRGVGPIDAIKESFNMVKGHFWSVFLFMIAALALNIVGMLLFGIGLLLTIPVTVIAIAHAYRTLSQLPVAAL